MSFHYTVYADQGQIVDPRFLEIPIQTTGRANLLVVATGVAGVATDEDDWHVLTGGSEEASVRGDIYVETNYKILDSDELIDSATWIALASIQADDDANYTIAVDSVEALRRTSNVIQIHITAATRGDASILRISYQTNLLIYRPS